MRTTQPPVLTVALSLLATVFYYIMLIAVAHLPAADAADAALELIVVVVLGGLLTAIGGAIAVKPLLRRKR